MSRRLVVDHIDNNKLNNHKDNLFKLLIKRINNSKILFPLHNTQVFLYGETSYKKWRAEIRINRKNKFLGRFHKEIDAAKTYQDELKT